jgi:hypothetical protein
MAADGVAEAAGLMAADAAGCVADGGWAWAAAGVGSFASITGAGAEPTRAALGSALGERAGLAPLAADGGWASLGAAAERAGAAAGAADGGRAVSAGPAADGGARFTALRGCSAGACSRVSTRRIAGM